MHLILVGVVILLMTSHFTISRFKVLVDHTLILSIGHWTTRHIQLLCVGQEMTQHHMWHMATLL